jgi:hypothetical protein
MLNIEDEKMRERCELWVLTHEPVSSPILEEIWQSQVLDLIPAEDILLDDWELQNNFLAAAARIYNGGEAVEDDELLFLYQRIFAVKYKNSTIADDKIKTLLDSATHNTISRNLAA